MGTLHYLKSVVFQKIQSFHSLLDISIFEGFFFVL